MVSKIRKDRPTLTGKFLGKSQKGTWKTIVFVWPLKTLILFQSVLTTVAINVQMIYVTNKS